MEHFRFPNLILQTGIFQDPTKDKWTEEDTKYKYRSKLEQLENENYDPSQFVGAPVGLQCLGRDTLMKKFWLLVRP